MVKMTSLVRKYNYRGQKQHKFNIKFINKNEDPGQIGNLFCRLLTKMDEKCMCILSFTNNYKIYTFKGL